MNEEKKTIYANFKRQNKLLGLIEYRVIVIILIYIIAVFSILKAIPIDTEFKIYTFSILVIPIIFVLFVNVNNESVIDIIINIVNYILKSKIYINIENEQDLNNKDNICIYIAENKK